MRGGKWEVENGSLVWGMGKVGKFRIIAPGKGYHGEIRHWIVEYVVGETHSLGY